MKKEQKQIQCRYKGLLALFICLVLVLGWFQMPEMVHATGNAFPEDSQIVDVIYDSGSEVEPEEEIDEKPASKPAGQVSVSIDDFYYGTTVTPQVSSSTGNAGNAKLTYKVTGADDSTYTSQMPTEVGNYTVLAILPDDTYYAATLAYDTFTISYLKAPAQAYELKGTTGENGWYKSEVTITPPAGYELSVGNRSSFSTDGYVVSEETNRLNFYLKQSSTGAMTDVITIANIRIDADAPEINNLNTAEEHYADSMEVTFKEEHFDSLTVNGKKAEAVEYADGLYGFTIQSEVRKMTYDIIIKDDAGNETKVSLVLGPAWMEDGVVGEGEYYLEPGVEYSFPESGQWKMSGDNTVYAGGVHFYANKEGTVTFTKQ